MKGEVRAPSFYDHTILGALSFGYDQFPFCRVVGREGERDFFSPGFSFLRMDRTDEGAENALQRARLLFSRGLRFEHSICFGFFGKLCFDLSNSSQTDRFAILGRIASLLDG